MHHVPVLLTVFTSMFLHGGWAHLGFNMLFLWIFGNNVEDRVGRRAVPRSSTCWAAWRRWACSSWPTAGSDVPNIGASGAIAAVLGGYLLLYPRALVMTLVGWIPIPLPAMLFLLIWILLQLAGGCRLGREAAGGGDSVAYLAHVGGFAFGLLAIRAFDPGPGGLSLA